jgi:hypothetical protein
MECRACNRRFDLFSYVVPHKGMMETYRGWVLKKLVRELGALIRKAEGKKALLRQQLRRQMSSAWLSHFAGQSKRRVWAELTGGGATYPSLAAFYSHVRHGGFESVLLGYLDGRNLERVQEVLKLERGPLNKLSAEIRKLQKAVKAKEDLVRRQAFR